MHPRCSLTHFIVPALWTGLASIVCGASILTYTEPTGEKIELGCPFEDTPDWCFVPVEIQAQNPGRQPADWRIAVSSSDYASGMTLRSGCDFRARAGDASRGSALMPIGSLRAGRGYGGNYVMFEATRAGGGGSRGGLSTRSSRSSSQPESERPILVAESVGFLHFSPQTHFNPVRAPGDWRAYCGYASMYLNARDWEAMTPAARTAIKHWTRLGGHLNLIGATSGKSLTELGLPKPDAGQETGGVSRGAINAAADDKIQESGIQNNEKIVKNDWVLRALSGESVGEWSQRDVNAFAIPSAKLAAGFMLVVVLAFAILAGPINVFVLAPARRRHRLFVTTPLISLGAGGLLVVSVILSDGIGGKGVRYVWMESGPGGENTNYLVQHQHSRCGAMFSTGFEIPEDAYFAPMVLESGEFSGNLSVQLEAGKVRADGPWFPSRRSQNFYLAAARPGRGRIEQSGTAERPVLTSAFDFPIERIFWLAPDGKTWWQAAAMPQGTATALQPCTEQEVQQALAAATAQAPPEYGRDLSTAIRRPGCFLAFADKISAIETHKSIRWQTHGFVTGPALAP